MKNNINSDLVNLKSMFLTVLDFDLDKPSNFDHHFCLTYRELLKLHPGSDEYDFYLLNCLFGIIEYMNLLKKSNETEYEKWKVRLVNNKNSVGLFGDIYELFIHWSLYMKGFSFFKTERPDFIVNWNESVLFVECGSTQFEFKKKPNDKQVYRKLKSVIRSNLTSGYLNYSTVLFIDITNLIFHLQNFNVEILSRAIKDVEIELKRNPSNYLNKPGAIIFMNFELIERMAHQNFAWNVTSIFFNPNVDLNLSAFLKDSFIVNIENHISNNPKFHH